ncbi:hypothetical protein FHS93_001895 [Sphingobium francense]|nr:hypothetical protein [Sphingobium indicum]
MGQHCVLRWFRVVRFIWRNYRILECRLRGRYRGRVGVSDWPTVVRHIPATHIANAAYPVMSVSATNRPVCIQNNNGPLRRLGERPYEGIIPVAKPRTRRTANRTAKAKGKIDALMTTDYGCSLRGSQCLHMVVRRLSRPYRYCADGK